MIDRFPNLSFCPSPGAAGVAMVASFVLSILMAGAAAAPAAVPEQAERVAVGDTAIDFTMQSIDGETYRLSDLRGEKNAIVIFFRGTW